MPCKLILSLMLTIVFVTNAIAQASSAPGTSVYLTGPLTDLVCPIANCPNPGTGEQYVSSAFSAVGNTTLGAAYVEWEANIGLYDNTGSPNGQKVSLYSGMVQGPLGGSAWALNTDIVRNGVPNGPNGQVGSSSPGTPGAILTSNSTIGIEADYTNWDADQPAGGSFTVDLYLHNQSNYASLAGIYYDSHPQLNNNFAWHDGLFFSGAYTVKDNSILDTTNSSYSYQVNGSHLAAIYDNSTSQSGLIISGSHSNQDILITDNTAPVGYSDTATHSNASIKTNDQIVSGYQYTAPLTGASVTIANNIGVLVINPAGTLATLTVTMPVSPTDGETINISTSQTITSLSIASGTAVIYGNVSSLSAGGFVSYRWIGTPHTYWQRVG